MNSIGLNIYFIIYVYILHLQTVYFAFNHKPNKKNKKNQCEKTCQR